MARLNPYDGSPKRLNPTTRVERESAQGTALPEGPACAGKDTEIFYPRSSDKKANRIALAICKRCVVRDRCLEKALEQEEIYGVWGGTTEEQRRILISKRRLTQASDSVQ